MNLENYGLQPGCHADMVVLQASSKQEVIRLRRARLFVIRRGRVISQMPETAAKVSLGAGENLEETIFDSYGSSLRNEFGSNFRWV